MFVPSLNNCNTRSQMAFNTSLCWKTKGQKSMYFLVQRQYAPPPPSPKVRGKLEFCVFGGGQKVFNLRGGCPMRGCYISEREVSSFSVRFLILKWEISKLQIFLPLARSFSIFAFLDWRWIFRFKMDARLLVNVYCNTGSNFLVQRAVSSHPTVGPQNQPNPWNCFLFNPFGGFRGSSKPSSQ